MLAPINKVPQYARRNFEIREFNKKFEDYKLLANMTPSDTVIYEMPGDKVLTIDMDLIDPRLTNGKNYTDPWSEDFIDPNKDSKTRIALVGLINKFEKKILVVPTRERHQYFIPGGFTKVVEPYNNAAVRIFRNITGITLDKKKIVKALLAKNKKGLEICTYLSFGFKETPALRKGFLWIPIKHLSSYNNPNFSAYYKLLHSTILQHLY